MLQAVIKKGKVFTEEVSKPLAGKGHVLIKVMNSTISSGTEVASIARSGMSLAKRAMEQPENIKKVLAIYKEKGLSSLVKKIEGKMDEVMPIGYSAAGIVMETGEDVNSFKAGDRVAAAGAGLANHSEFINVPENLVIKMPADLDFPEASTVSLGGIALQGVRRSGLLIGEFGVVFGTGIIGLLTVQILRNSGVRVIAVDIDDERLSLAKEVGAEFVLNSLKEDIIKLVSHITGGYGADAVIFTAATNDSSPLSASFQICKKKGRVVLVGVSGMEIRREDIYAKELDFMISTSYGPGRYDDNFEKKGLDYPYAYVRWTENRNMQEYLRLLQTGSIKLDKLINYTFPIENVETAYETVQDKSKKALLVILEYGHNSEEREPDYRTINIKPAKNSGVLNVGIIGAGAFAAEVHLPNLAKLKDKYRIYAIANNSGLKAKQLTEKYSACYSTTNYKDIINDEQIDLVMICTRHGNHGELVLESLKAGKNVFVEKPLAVNADELKLISDFYFSGDAKEKPFLMVGFNRRFSDYITEIKGHASQRTNPLFIHYRMNAGYIPLDHWVHEDGGRIIGEACHIVDLAGYIINAEPVSIYSEEITPANSYYSGKDNKTITIKYKDGSICVIDYFAMGNKSLPKEYLELHFDGKSIIMDDYKSLKGYGVSLKEIKPDENSKGHLNELKQIYEAIKQNRQLIDLRELIRTTKLTFDINDSAI